MTEHNHRRGTRGKDIVEIASLHRGCVTAGNEDFRSYPNMHGKVNTGRDYAFARASDRSILADKTVSSKGIGNDFCKGRRGAAKDLRGAKKFVRSRIRFHEKAAVRVLMQDI